MDPATGNNGWYLPLVIFDPIMIQALIPPRIYLQEPYLPKGKTFDDVRKLLPAGTEILRDESTLYKGSYYVPITPIADEKILKEWARVPLGQFEADREFWPLYDLVFTPVNNGPLTGAIPGYWNYYGSMKYKYLDVRVTSVATGIEDGEEVLIHQDTADAPADLKALIGAGLSMNMDLADDSTNASVMIDLLPTMSMYSQIFTDRLTLYKADRIFFSGKPCKSSLRLVNPFRVINENMPFAGAGVFISTISIDDGLEAGELSPILDLFRRYGSSQKKLKGVMIYQIVSEIEENRKVDYRRDGNIANPAYGTISGRICPWYEGEMRSWTIARQLVGENPYIIGRKPPYQAPVCMMSPAQFQFREEDKVLVLDFLNNFPVRLIGEGEGPFDPDPRDQNQYEVYPMGQLEVYLEKIDAKNQIKDQLKIGTFTLDESVKSREQLYKDGGMYVLPLPEALAGQMSKYKNWNLSIYAAVNQRSSRIMTESPVVIVSDQAGLYANQGDDQIKGYVSYTGKREPCRLRIFERGVPSRKPREVTVVEYQMSSSGALHTEALFRLESYRDGDLVTFDTTEPRNAIYLFIPYRTYVLPPHGYPSAVIQTGFFVSVKVLPFHAQDFGPYLDPAHPEYPQEVTFEVIYEHIFKCYGLLMPTMNFHKERFENPAMAAELLRRMDIRNWEYAWYMPASRDLSEDEYELLQRWAEQFRKRRPRHPHNPVEVGDIVRLKHLKGRHFFNK